MYSWTCESLLGTITMASELKRKLLEHEGVRITHRKMI